MNSLLSFFINVHFFIDCSLAQGLRDRHQRHLGFLKLVSVFKGASKTFIFDLLNIKDTIVHIQNVLLFIA
jgi:hypothetical protein